MNRFKSLPHFGVALICALLISNCTSKTLPDSVQGVLKKYVETSFSIENIGDKSKLVALLTGEAKAGLESWNDQLFEASFISRKRKFEKLRIIENKKNSENEHGITYELTFRDDAQGGVGARVLQRKMALIVKVNDEWKIREVRSIKELVEYSDGMSFP